MYFYLKLKLFVDVILCCDIVCDIVWVLFLVDVDYGDGVVC